MAGMRIVQSFSAEKETEKTFDELLHEQRTAFKNAVIYADAFGPIVDFCWGIGTLSLYFVGVKVFGVDQVPVGTLIAFGTYIQCFGIHY